MQTILGANGVIGRELSRQLPQFTNRVRQVSRSPRAVNPTDEIFSADLLDPNATADAVAGSEVTYLVAGLKYDHKVWQEQWPRVMRNAIDACKRHGSALVFFDNVYAYGRVNGVDEVTRGELRGAIVRAADFYGPGAVLSVTRSAIRRPCTHSRTRATPAAGSR